MDNKYKNKFKEYDGIKFRSNLEAACYRLLKESGIEFEYEPSRFIIMPSLVYDPPAYERSINKGRSVFGLKNKIIPKISYKPDFVGKWWIMETKGRETPDFRNKWKLFKKFLKDHNMNYVLFKPHTIGEIKECIEIIKNIENGKESRKTVSTSKKMDGRH